MLDDRKSAILRAVVECHIRTAQPVSSAYVAQLGDLGVSPATVRNEMAVLEQEGYLFQPHASAGRVPTDKGYRFFVDSLPGPAALDPSQAELVRMFFARTHGELERHAGRDERAPFQAHRLRRRGRGPGGARAGPSAFPAAGQAHRPDLVLAVAVLANAAVERRPLELSDRGLRRPGRQGLGQRSRVPGRCHAGQSRACSPRRVTRR